MRRQACAWPSGKSFVAASTDPTGGAPAWTVTPLSQEKGNNLVSVSCPSASVCVAGDDGGNVVTSENPTGGAAAWRVANIDKPQDGDYLPVVVSCATASLCVAVDSDCPTGSYACGVAGQNGGHIWSSTNPTGGSAAWSNQAVGSFGQQFTAVSCPSASLCFAIGTSSSVSASHNEVLTTVIASSSDPTGGAGDWTVTPLDTKVAGQIDCPSASLCVAGDPGNGGLIASSQPAGAASTWTPTGTFAGNGSAQQVPDTVSCPTDTSCFVLDNDDVYASTTPALANPWTVADSNSYTATRHIAGSPLLDVSCASARLCVAINQAGDVLTSTNPATAHTWSSEHVDDAKAMSAISCPSTSLCVAVDYDGYVLTSTDPTARRASWKRARIVGGRSSKGTGLVAVYCRSNRFCLAGDSVDDLFVSRDPTGGRRAWREAVLPENGDSPGVMSGIACPRQSLCVGVDQSTGEGFINDIFTSTDPTGGSNHWKLTTNFDENSFSGDNTFEGVSCPAASLCVAATQGGYVITSTRPTKASSWQGTETGTSGSLNAVACPSTSLCMTADSSGSVQTSSDPGSATALWQSQTIDHAQSINALSCASTTLCVAATQDGNVIVGTG